MDKEQFDKLNKEVDDKYDDINLRLIAAGFNSTEIRLVHLMHAHWVSDTIKIGEIIGIDKMRILVDTFAEIVRAASEC